MTIATRLLTTPDVVPRDRVRALVPDLFARRSAWLDTQDDPDGLFRH